MKLMSQMKLRQTEKLTNRTKNMNIAITGASGFIGMELLAVLSKRNDVTVIALTRDASLFEDSARCCWRSTDYSEESLKAIFMGAAKNSDAENAACSMPVDAVIHLAGVRGTENDPEKFAVNVTMTENILKAMHEAGVKRIVFASTMSVYNDDSLMPWKEDAPLRGRSCYGDSKADCEDLIKKYARQTGEAAGSGETERDSAPFTYGIARIAQVLGEGEKRRGMMNVFMDTAREHGTLRVMGKSVIKKQYIYVKDLVNVLTILACGNDIFSAEQNITVNVGMREAYTNLEVAHTVNRVFGNPAPIDYDDSYPERGRPFHMDISRLTNCMGYIPLDLEFALRQI